TSNGELYAVGGLESCQSLVTPVEKYDASTGVVTLKAPMPVAAYKPGIASTSTGRIYVMGGCLPPSVSPGGPPSAVLTAVQVYDTQSDTWTTGTPLTEGRWYLGAAA